MLKITKIAIALTGLIALTSCTQSSSMATPTFPIGLFATPISSESTITTSPIDVNWGSVPSELLYPTPIVNMAGSNQQKILMVEDYRGRHIVETETIPINNCSGKDTVKVSVARTKAYSSTIGVGTEATAGIDEIIKITVAAQYNISIGESKNYEVSVEFSAQPNTNTIYTIEWAETWVIGRVFFLSELNNGQMNPVQYFTKSELQVNIPDSIVQACPP